MKLIKRLSKSERKKEIMESAMKVILKKGLEKSTMEEIVAGTTLSKGGVHHYYSNVNEIFKDLMILGIEYRTKIINEHIYKCNKNSINEFMAKELVEKVIDDNPYMPLYVEFLINKKRNPELQKMMLELQEKTKESIENVINNSPKWLTNSNIYQFLTDIINALILASDILEARENFKNNKILLEKIFICILNEYKENL